MSLAKARERTSAHRAAIVDGQGPTANKHNSNVPTFREAAYADLELNRPRWRSAKHGANWIQMLERHAMPRLGKMHIDRIDQSHVLVVLTPIWTARQRRPAGSDNG